ncbi:unnamed protein product, partial [Nesidiocoris tenuis]
LHTFDTLSPVGCALNTQTDPPFQKSCEGGLTVDASHNFEGGHDLRNNAEQRARSLFYAGESPEARLSSRVRPGAHLRQNDAGRRVIFNRITRNTQRSIVRCTRDADTYLQLASLRIGIEVDASTCGTRVGADSYPAARYPYQYSRGNRPVHTYSQLPRASSIPSIFSVKIEMNYILRSTAG